ncbi:MAG: chromosome segregation protein [Pirellulaceae bacterium]|nr:MAG: chromosome segregation protein [Pirellulaceae bacterium]
MRETVWVCMGIAASLVACGVAQGEEPRVDYLRQIRPILADNCFRCHGPDEAARQSGLRLDVRELATAPADSGQPAIVPGSPEQSELLRRVTSEDPSERMPPPETKLSLSGAQIDLLRRWIAQGAHYQEHWSRTPLRRPALPSRSPWADEDHPIDRFIDARLQEQQLRPLGKADRYHLIRRLYLDLTGLPPDPEEVDRFIADRSPDAYERLVDRLLASPAFGERMAWDWLDAARYADSNGYQGDAERTMWPWRDWVISAWNRNMPFDRFTVWQLAGDLLPDATDETRLATGFCRNHMINGEGGRIPEENRVDYVMDMIETVATVWLAATMNCARCHDHKYDPFTRRDYYSLFAFFNQTPVDGAGGNPQTPPVLEVPTEEQRVAVTELEGQLAKLRAELLAQEKTLLEGSSPDSLPEEVRTILQHSPDKRDADQWQRLDKHLEGADSYRQLAARWREWKKRYDQLRREIPRVMVMADRDEYRPTYMLEKGLYNRPAEEVFADVPQCLPPLGEGGKRNRLALAEWLVRPDNPLTARVVANRLWQQFFGTGLVRTPEDFGTQGEPPTHPELLDWLACELIDSGWDIKRFCRLLVTSRAYRRDSRATPELLEADPENRWLARGVRYRLPSWMIRDQALAASGLLVAQLGGPPVFPYQPQGVWEEATFGNKSYRQDRGAKLYRRSLYTFWRRIIAPTMFFDVASRQVCTVRVTRTNSPLHALVTMNDITYVEAARELASRQWRAFSQEGADRLLESLFRRVLVRPPQASELEILRAALARWEAYYTAHPEAAEALLSVGEAPRSAGPATQLAALTVVAHTLLNLDEALSKE